jgi:hypothetical protein
MRPYLLVPRFAANRLWLAAREVPSWHIAPARTGNVRDLVTGADLVTFTNSSPAWGFNRSGILVQPAANVPFIEYDPATGSALGWRIWDAVTNLALHSRDLTQTAWVKSGITPTRDQIGADGTANTATRLTATSSDGTALQTITSASATRVSGFLVKRITGTGVIQITQDGGATWNTVSITNQWLRYPIASATVTNPQIGFRIRSSGDEIAVDFAQLQSSSTLGPPVETGALTASSTADVASITGAAFAGIWNQVGTTVYSDIKRPFAVPSGFPRAWQASDGTSANRIEQTYYSGGQANVISSGGTTQAEWYPAYYAENGIRAALAFATNNVAGASNGAITGTDNLATMPAVDRIFIGSEDGTANSLRGYIRELAILRSRRPNSNLQAMTQ